MLFKNVFYTDESFWKFLDDNSIGSKIDREMSDLIYYEFTYFYQSLDILNFETFKESLLTQFKRNLNKLILLKNIKDNPLKDLNDAITKRISKSGSKANATPITDESYIKDAINLDVYSDKDFDFEMSDSQSAESSVTTSINNINLRTGLIRRNDITNGLREFVESFNILFKKYDWYSLETSNKYFIEIVFKRIKEMKQNGNFLFTGNETINQFFNKITDEQKSIYDIYDYFIKLLGITDISPVKKFFDKYLFLVNINNELLEFDEQDYSKTLNDFNIKFITLDTLENNIQIIE